MVSAALYARMRTVAALVSLASVFATLTSSSDLRRALASLFHPSRHPVRLTTLIAAILLNIKSMPLAWSFRFFRIMIYQLYFQRKPLPPPSKQPRPTKQINGNTPQPKEHDTLLSSAGALFLPMLTTSMYTPLLETDYNGHKSNSTYFADLDMARTQLVSCLLRKGIRQSGVGSDGHIIAMGAVSCHFKREIKPYARFDIWTRVLSWDRKWMYIISHMVRPGAVQPDGWALQPWKKGITGKGKGDDAEQDRGEWQKAICATSISKYVVKKGRMTVSPEYVLNHSDLLPPAPSDEERRDATAVWTWDLVEQERKRGLTVAEKFGALDAPGGLHDEFPVAFGKGHCDGKVLGVSNDEMSSGTELAKRGKIEVLGEFRDLVL